MDVLWLWFNRCSNFELEFLWCRGNNSDKGNHCCYSAGVHCCQWPAPTEVDSDLNCVELSSVGQVSVMRIYSCVMLWLEVVMCIPVAQALFSSRTSRFKAWSCGSLPIGRPSATNCQWRQSFHTRAFPTCPLPLTNRVNVTAIKECLDSHAS